MNKHLFLVFSCIVSGTTFAQDFERSELSASLTAPWEIIYGPDNFLWVSEGKGDVSRVDPQTGIKNVIYSSRTYFEGDTSETCRNCFKPKIGSGTLGMALHPEFASNPYVYFAHSYNSGNSTKCATKFCIERIKWSEDYKKVTEDTVLVTNLPNGYDHLGGRLIIAKQDNHYYLFYSTGDNGVSETNSPGCYNPESSNPNCNAQDPDYHNGKILRFNLDGSVPDDNPIKGNPVYTRGHRNPQGLVFNPVTGLVYDIEHGDRTDDEINLLEKGMNYGWKYIRGYHSDNNYPGEATAIANYTPNPYITGDGLREPIFTWCSTPQPTTANNNDWCTVAPSGGEIYNSNMIPGWKNSILVVTLKNGTYSDMEMYRVRLSEDGRSVLPSTNEAPNPLRYFTSDQNKNGRLRDLAISPDGRNVYLINNGGADRDKITVYHYTGPDPAVPAPAFVFDIFPNSLVDDMNIHSTDSIASIVITNAVGDIVHNDHSGNRSLGISSLQPGMYYVTVKSSSGAVMRRKVVR